MFGNEEMTNKNLHINEEDFSRYLDNKMTETERNAFEKELQKHPFEAEAMEGFEAVYPINIQSDLNEIKAKLKPAKRRNNLRYWAAAASVLLVVSAGVIWMQVKDQNQISEMAEIKTIEKEEKQQEKAIKIMEPSLLINETEKATFSETTPQIENEPETSKKPQTVIDKPRQKSAQKKRVETKQVTQPTNYDKSVITVDVATDTNKTRSKNRNVTFAQQDKKAKISGLTENYQVSEAAPISAVVGAPAPEQKYEEKIFNANAHPDGGIKNYNTYLDSVALLPDDYTKKKAVVKIRFEIDSLGIIFNFININGADTLLFTKAKNIIIDGQKWSPEIKDKKRLNSRVKLKIVFRK